MCLLDELKEIFKTKCSYYEDKKDIVRGFNNGEFICSSGSISELIYYYQTLDLYKRYPIETLELIQEIKEELGELEILEDEDTTNKINKMIWLIFEYYCYIWIDEIEEEEEEINYYIS